MQQCATRQAVVPTRLLLLFSFPGAAAVYCYALTTIWESVDHPSHIIFNQSVLNQHLLGSTVDSETCYTRCVVFLCAKHSPPVESSNACAWGALNCIVQTAAGKA